MKTSNFQRFLACMLAVIMLLSLAACSSWESGTLEGSTDSLLSQMSSNNATRSAQTHTVTVYASVPTDWLSPHCWAWQGDRDAFDAWPGKAMTKQGDWYVAEVPAWVDSVIISNCGNPQTADLSVQKGKDVWIVVDEDASAEIHYSKPNASPSSGENTVTVHANVPASWRSIFCWAWQGDRDAFDAWPGKAMTKQGDWYVAEVPAWIDSIVISSGPAQTADLSVRRGRDVWIVVDADGAAQIFYTQPQPTVEDTVTVHAHVPSDWSAFCWAWNDDKTAFDFWPGVAMARKDGWFSTEVPNWVTSIIISNCGDPQTVDLSVQKGKDVWVVVNEDASAEIHYSKPNVPNSDPYSGENTVTVHAQVPASWRTPFCWVWSGDRNAFDNWPGIALAKSENWYQVEIPNWIDTLILSNNGKPQTQDLSVPKGKDLWIVVKANGDISVHESEPKPAADQPSPYTMQHSDLKYVMVYNPNIYDERVNWNTNSLDTGILASKSNAPVVNNGNATVNSAPESQNHRAAGSYKVGDTRQFYCTTSGSKNVDVRSLRGMTCGYVGKYCYVWHDGSMTPGLMQTYGQEFDNHVYEEMVALLGEVAWNGNERKVHLLYYPLGDAADGYFSPTDMLSSNDISASDAAEIQANLDHTILHFNATSAKTGDQRFAKSSLAHEFQHLLCYSATVNNGDGSRMWLNEAMSAYIEEYFRPGIKRQCGYVQEYNNGLSFQTGTSLYNFNTELAAYGLVYCFSEYLTAYGGEDVFVKIHDNWRKSNGRSLSEAQVIYNSVSGDFRNLIDSSFDYAGSVKFANREEEWMSKLTLHFYLNMLNQEKKLPYHSDLNISSLLYTKDAAVTVEGGGRILLATDGGFFTIPGDADAGLVYFGLNKDFKIVTHYIDK